MEPTIGEAIKVRLESMGMSKAELARRLHMSSANVHKIFKRSSTDIELLKRISEALGYDFISHYTYLTTKGISATGVLRAAPFAPATHPTRPERRTKLRLMLRTCQALASEKPDRPASHLLEELDFAIDLLNDIKTDILSENPTHYHDETWPIPEQQVGEQSDGSPQDRAEQTTYGRTDPQ